MEVERKSRCCSCCRRHPFRLSCAAIWACIVSAALTAGFGVLYNPSRVEFKAFANELLSLTPDTFVTSYWLKLPTTNSIVYFFNVTNPYDVQHKGAKPILEEIGPFQYIKEPIHYNTWWSEDVTLLKYDKNVSHIFNPNATGEDPYNTNITTLNAPLITLIQFIERIEADPQYEKLRKILEEVFGFADYLNEILKIEPLFITKTADELSFGYEDPLLKILHNIDPSLVPSANFSFRHRVQVTTQNMMYTGKNDSCKRRGEFALWNGLSSIDHWGTPTARMINGSDATMFSTFLNESDQLYIYTDEFERSAYFNFTEEVDFEGITAFRYVLPEAEYNSCLVDPGFYPNGPSGVMNLSAVQTLNAPVFVSKPHFLDADPEYLHNVTGLQPNRTLHDSYLIVEPVTGLTIDAAKRIQVNIQLVQYPKLMQFKNLSSLTMLPIFYTVEAGSLSTGTAYKLRMDLYSAVYGSEALMFFLIGMCGIISLSTLLCFIIMFSKGLAQCVRRQRGGRQLVHHVTENSPLILDTNS